MSGRVPAAAGASGVRSRERLAEQVETIERYLRAKLSDEDRAASASPGYRPRDWEPDRRPAYPDPTNPEHRAWRPHPRETPRYQAEAERILDAIADVKHGFPLYLREGVERELRKLGWEERLIIELHCVCGLSWREVPQFAPSLAPDRPLLGHLSHQACWRRHERVLEDMARRIWAEDGAPRYEHVNGRR